MFIDFMPGVSLLSFASFYDVAGDCPEGLGPGIERGNRFDRLVNQIVGEFF
jgi:hypothetical protein